LDLERRLAEAERAKSEAEQLAERALMLERQHYTEHRMSVSGQGSASFGSGSCSDADNSCQSTTHQNSSNIYYNSTGLSPSQSERTIGQVAPDKTGRNSGYERYLATFHQPTIVNNGAITKEDPVRGSTPTLADDNAATIALTSKITDRGGSSIKGSDSDQIFCNYDNIQSVSSDDDAPRRRDLNPLVTNISSLQENASIESVNLDDPKLMRSFLIKPCPKVSGMVHCCVRRNKGLTNALFPEYRMYLNRMNSKTETFLMTSKKRGKTH
jgi:hypothetical protein